MPQVTSKTVARKAPRTKFKPDFLSHRDDFVVVEERSLRIFDNDLNPLTEKLSVEKVEIIKKRGKNIIAEIKDPEHLTIYNFVHIKWKGKNKLFAHVTVR